MGCIIRLSWAMMNFMKSCLPSLLLTASVYPSAAAYWRQRIGPAIQWVIGVTCFSRLQKLGPFWATSPCCACGAHHMAFSPAPGGMALTHMHKLRATLHWQLHGNTSIGNITKSVSNMPTWAAASCATSCCARANSAASSGFRFQPVTHEWGVNMDL